MYGLPSEIRTHNFRIKSGAPLLRNLTEFHFLVTEMKHAERCKVPATSPLCSYSSGSLCQIMGTPSKYQFMHRKEVNLTRPLFSGIEHPAPCSTSCVFKRMKFIHWHSNTESWPASNVTQHHWRYFTDMDYFLTFVTSPLC